MSYSVVYVAGTGHVVGALALTGSAATPSLAELVGPALPLRVSLGPAGTVSLPLPARLLGALAADAEPGVLTDPLARGVDRPPAGPPGRALLRLAAWPGGVTLESRGVTVELPVAGTRDTPVAALVSGARDTDVLTGVIPAGQRGITLPIALEPAAEHGVLVLPAGWAGKLLSARVS
ncbi:hypothetical protein [Streptomyces sp. CAU 1734]|uniref:hypothetical protein n=1 Tax=Streptomyces sp. CAU 1734 TaxID=3140360 RepID=UPI003261A182